MSISVNGQSCVPPGFRFHPTEEELLNYYLRKKVASEKIDLDVIRDVDLNKLEPWDIQEKCRIGSTPQNDWYFFSHKDKKYPTGTRTNRATAAGFWKATGRDKVIYASSKRIGMRKTLVFYRGRAPHGQKCDWIMHEYRLDDHTDATSHSHPFSSIGEAAAQEDGWVVCRVFKKKNLHKPIDSPNNCSTITSDTKTQLLHSASDGALDQILQYMGRSCKQEREASSSNHKYVSSNPSSHGVRYLRPIETVFGSGFHDRFMKLPALESPSNLALLPDDYPLPPPAEHACGNHAAGYPAAPPEGSIHAVVNMDSAYHSEPGINDWAALDRLVASHLNGQSEASRQLSCFDDSTLAFCSSGKPLLASNSQDYHGGGGVGGGGGDGDLWSFTRSASSASDHLSPVSL